MAITFGGTDLKKREPISVIMATYNGSRFVIQQIRSILNQLEQDDELIISDDSSTDNTVNLIKDIGDDRIKIYENQKFRHHAKNFAYALTKAKHDYIFLSDQDDLWVQGKVQQIMLDLRHYDMILTDSTVIDDQGRVLIPSIFQKHPFRAKPGLVRNLLQHSYSGCCMAFHKKILRVALPLPAKIEYHDFWLGFIANLFYKVKFIKTPLTLYRKHGNNVSFGTAEKSGNTLYQKLMLRQMLINHLPLILYRRFLKSR